MKSLLVNANALRIPLAAGSVHCCVTSPPYYNLRDYSTPGQIGLEDTVGDYVAAIVAVFREVKRVLRDDATCWVNLGDSYASAWSCNRRSTIGADAPSLDERANRLSDGLKEKDLMGIPWRVAFALQADGWYLRSDIVWSKPNPMPESVTDRPTKSHEYLFLLSKSARYFYDADAIREGRVSTGGEFVNGWATEGEHTAVAHNVAKPERAGKLKAYSFARKVNEEPPPGQPRNHRENREDVSYIGSRNKRTVWTIATAPYSGAHFATYPPALVEPCIKAGTSERGVCPACGAPWRRVVERGELTAGKGAGRLQDYTGTLEGVPEEQYRGANFRKSGFAPGHQYERNHRGWSPTCTCDAGDPIPATVLDPFNGAATTGLVCQQLGRRYVGLDLSPEYLRLSRERLGHTDLEAWVNGKPANETVDLGPLFS